MYRVLTLLLLLIFAPVVVAEGVTIYLDIDGDVTHNERRAPRLKLKKQKGLELGRMAGVWGSVGKSDRGDAFFLGKTSMPARMQFTLAGARGSSPVELSIKAKDGSEIVQHKIAVNPGETVKQWLVLKGRINVKLTSPTKKESLYAVYFWYPGDKLDGMSDSEFARVESGKIKKINSFARRAKGRAKR